MHNFEMGGGGQKRDSSRMIVVCEMGASLLGGSGGMPPRHRKILNLYPLRLLLTQSGTKFQTTFCDTYLCSVTYKWLANIIISRFLGGWGISPPSV